MTLAAYLSFNGNAREAVKFYEEVFGADAGEIMTYGSFEPDDSGFEMPEEMKNLVMHAQMEVAGDLLMFSDAHPANPVSAGSNITVAYVGRDTAAIESAFAKLAASGSVDMPLQPTGWSPLYGQVTDKYGVQWQFNYDEKYA